MPVTIKVRVTPRSSRNEIRVEGGITRAWVTASPTDGQANESMIALFAKKLGIAPSRVSLVSGHTARDKTLSIEGLTEDEVSARLV